MGWLASALATDRASSTWPEICCARDEHGLGRAAEVNHPLDVDLVEMAEHLRGCQLCRLKFARVMYKPIVELVRELEEKLREK